MISHAGRTLERRSVEAATKRMAPTSKGTCISNVRVDNAEEEAEDVRKLITLYASSNPIGIAMSIEIIMIRAVSERSSLNDCPVLAPLVLRTATSHALARMVPQEVKAEPTADAASRYAKQS